MSTVDTETFIECVKKYPIVYNRRHKFYNNFARKTQAWEFIGREMNESSEVLRIKWKGLKDGYTKYKRYREGVTPSNKSYHSWCWSEHLQFLDDYVINKNYSKPELPSITSLPSLSPLPSAPTGSPPPLTSPLSGVENNYAQDNLTPVQWPVNPMFQYDPNHSMSVTDEEFEAKQQQQKLDAVDHLFTSYAGTFRKFSLKSRCVLKIQMAKIFADAELAEFANVPETLGGASTSQDKDPLTNNAVSTTHIKQEALIEIEKIN